MVLFFPLFCGPHFAWRIMNNVITCPMKCGMKLLIDPSMQVWEWISRFIPHFNGCNYLSMLGLKLNHIFVKGTPRNKLPMVWIVAWRQRDTKPSSRPIMTLFSYDSYLHCWVKKSCEVFYVWLGLMCDEHATNCHSKESLCGFTQLFLRVYKSARM